MVSMLGIGTLSQHRICRATGASWDTPTKLIRGRRLRVLDSEASGVILWLDRH